jgi:undecaprenyl phosphate-alpha-L-ara4N flippase subunit ArnE
MTAATIALLVASQVVLVVSQLFLKHAMNLTEREPRPWVTVAAHFTLVVALMTFWFLMWLGFLQTMPLSQVLPWEGLAPLFLVVGAAVFLKERISPQAWIGMVLISAGIVLVSLS